MPPLNTDIFDTFQGLSNNVLRTVYLPKIYDIAFSRERTIFADRIRRDSSFVDGNALEVSLSFLTGQGFSFRSMGEFGFTPTGAPMEDKEQKMALGCSAGAVSVTNKAIKATQGDHSAIGRIIARKMEELVKQFPYYMRAQLWTGSNGIMGVVSGVAANVVTLDTGLWNNDIRDRAKYFQRGMYIQFLNSAGDTPRGEPVRITAINRKTGTVTIASTPAGVVATDIMVMSDIAGLENNYANSINGIFDVIDDDNTFQNIDRSLGENADFRAVKHYGSTPGTAEALSYERASEFFHDLFDPELAITDYRVIKKYWKDNINANQRYTGSDMDFKDGVRSIMIDKTRLVEDDDAHVNKIIVPDFKNMYIADLGSFKNLFDEGWKSIQGRPMLEYIVEYWCQLVAEDCRYMGVMEDVLVP